MYILYSQSYVSTIHFVFPNDVFNWQCLQCMFPIYMEPTQGVHWLKTFFMLWLSYCRLKNDLLDDQFKSYSFFNNFHLVVSFKGYLHYALSEWNTLKLKLSDSWELNKRNLLLNEVFSFEFHYCLSNMIHFQLPTDKALSVTFHWKLSKNWTIFNRCSTVRISQFLFRLYFGVHMIVFKGVYPSFVFNRLIVSSDWLEALTPIIIVRVRWLL